MDGEEAWMDCTVQAQLDNRWRGPADQQDMAVNVSWW